MCHAHQHRVSLPQRGPIWRSSSSRSRPPFPAAAAPPTCGSAAFRWRSRSSAAWAMRRRAPGRTQPAIGAAAAWSFRIPCQKQRPKVVVSYDAIGSGEGTQQFLAGTVDFGASDAALSDAEMATVKTGTQLVPIMAGSIVLAYNVDE